MLIGDRAVTGRLSGRPGRSRLVAGSFSPCSDISKSLQGNRLELGQFSRRSIVKRVVVGPFSPCRTVYGSIDAYRGQSRDWPSLWTAGSEQTRGWLFFPL